MLTGMGMVCCFHEATAMIESIHWLLPWAVAVSTTAFLAWIIIALVCDKSRNCKGPRFGKAVLSLSKVSPVGVMILIAILAVAVVKGGGKTNGTEQAGSDLPGTNGVEQVEGGGAATTDVSQLGGARLGSFGFGGSRPRGSAALPENFVTDEDISNQWRLVSVSSNVLATATFTMPPHATVWESAQACGRGWGAWQIPIGGWNLRLCRWLFPVVIHIL